MAGYNEYSKSNNAIDVENEGLSPLTRAIVLVAEQANCTKKKARETLIELGASEYHHTSKHYNITDYYNVKEAVNYILYGKIESPEEEAEYDREIEKIIQEKPKQSSCEHNFISVLKDRKKALGGGKVFSHFRCLKCELINN